jgi:prepilin-type N-terminal cleavage/methylation domain-containing protein
MSRLAQKGFSLVEVLLATVILLLALVPAIEALSSASHGAGVQQSEVQLHFQLREKMAQILAEAFQSLDQEAQSIASPSSASVVYSDPPGIRYRRRVYLSRYDADNADGDNDPFTGIDAGLLWVRVDTEHTAYVLETLVSDYE